MIGGRRGWKICGSREHRVKKIFSARVHKVSAKENPVWLGMANISSSTECTRNQGCRIYRITGKITEPGVQSCRT